ncbi:UDP-N-acetylmuramoyl-L-alanyl-D-glutamate--2,6-diaminopimelate ligase [Candidatus Peregrinibacteria bacterium]|nr:UDP-N-acetylmuramoyl-L-alanyl-D-glutamate--2,6-diaminopimelate ligase [Candidatus Peregrinibacteria bacterium]
MKDFLRKLMPDQHPMRLAYHKMMAVAAAWFYGFPAKKMLVVAVTGTNGKTTTANMLHTIFMEAGKKAGMLTTVNFKVGSREESNKNKQTTMPPFTLQRKLKQMLNENCEVAIVEATSHAMIQNRLWGIPVDSAVFTNLTQDHLSYHGDMDSYMQAKGKLFEQLNGSYRKTGVPKISVINQDDPSHEYFDKFPADQPFPYGIQRGIYSARNLELRPDGTDFDLKIPNGEERVNLKIPGKMNVYNALAASTVAVANRVNLKVIKQALEKMQPVSGRVDTIDEGQPFTVVVDYAHSEDSLDKLLSMFRELTKGNLIVAFGATGGGRDQTKRPKMGAIAHKYADKIILTNDDVYEEDPNEIAAMVKEGIPREEGDGFWQVLDRKEAIRLALSMAKEGDSVVIAGKGGEEVIVIGKELIPYDDRQVVREVLSRPVDIHVPSAV